jgi:hypothetical protein
MLCYNYGLVLAFNLIYNSTIALIYILRVLVYIGIIIDTEYIYLSIIKV